MNNKLQTYQGYISHFPIGNNFGFISTEEDRFFFFLNSNELRQLRKSTGIKSSHSFCLGDEVEFQLRPSQKDNIMVEAYNLKFIRNVRRQDLVSEARINGILYGFLKQINESFFVKHESTYVFLPVKISEWETDLDEVYLNRLNELVPFTLTQLEKMDKLQVELTDRKFSGEYQMISQYMKTGRTTEAKITGRNADGIFATVFNDTLKGFIRFSKQATSYEQEKFKHLKKGDTTLVSLKANQHIKQLSLTLAED